MTELLIVGGLTIDRFADGSSAPGGAVIHAGRAAVAEGAPVTILTVAGNEPEAAAGLAQLAELGDLLHQRAPSTVTYRHREIAGRRVLTYLAGAAPIRPPVLVDPPGVALLAPIADELPVSGIAEMRAMARPRLTVLILQGWLRRLVVGEPVRPRALDDVSEAEWAVFGASDAVVVSSEDLAKSPDDPLAAAGLLRDRMGPRPIVVLTLGERGYVLDDPSADRVVERPAPRVVSGVPTVGAGDTFGAALAIHLGRGEGPEVAADAATECVIRLLLASRA